MSWLSDAFAQGGPGMIPTAIFGLLLVGVSLLYAVRPEKRFVPLLVSTTALTLVAGAFGFVSGVIKSIAAMGETTDLRFPILGTGESLNNVALALGLIFAAMLATSIGALRHARRSPAA
jgi:hypothetical protein